jgi:cation diffusion facilitator family transporter
MARDADPIDALTHSHVFLGSAHDANARRTLWVVILTAAMMVAEIAAGWAYGSMALLADGFHMATHAGALGVSAIAYSYARRHATNARFTFGTGKVGDLAGFASALVLGLAALGIAADSLGRLLAPQPVAFLEASIVASLGLVVNLASAVLLSGGQHGHSHAHGHRHGPAESQRVHRHGHAGAGHHEHEHRHAGAEHHHGHDHRHVGAGHHHDEHDDDHGEPGHTHGPCGHDHGHHHGPHDSAAHAHAHHHHTARIRHEPGGPGTDNNLRSAYLHVFADALTSVLAISALVAGHVLGWAWLDPAVGILGAVIIGRWSWTLMRDTAAVLLDATNPQLEGRVRERVERGDARITDLHVWRVGPEAHAAIVSVTGPADAETVRARLRGVGELAHVTVEHR